MILECWQVDCSRVDTHPYISGPFCDEHAPAARAGRTIPVAAPELSAAGLRPAPIPMPDSLELIAIACRLCAAEAGAPCVGPSMRRPGIDFHLSRRLDAGARRQIGVAG